MTKVGIQTQIGKPRLAPSVASTVLPTNRPSYDEWHQGIRSELHTPVPEHRQPLKWHLNTFKNGK